LAEGEIAPLGAAVSSGGGGDGTFAEPGHTKGAGLAGDGALTTVGERTGAESVKGILLDCPIGATLCRTDSCDLTGQRGACGNRADAQTLGEGCAGLPQGMGCGVARGGGLGLDTRGDLACMRTFEGALFDEARRVILGTCCGTCCGAGVACLQYIAAAGRGLCIVCGSPCPGTGPLARGFHLTNRRILEGNGKQGQAN